MNLASIDYFSQIELFYGNFIDLEQSDLKSLEGYSCGMQ